MASARKIRRIRHEQMRRAVAWTMCERGIERVAASIAQAYRDALDPTSGIADPFAGLVRHTIKVPR